ncbi:MAG: thiosulfate oxidation carrier complex protein SoxZ, partial [Roseobacter sp.]
AIVPESGEFKFTWYDDDGSVYEAANEITVS